MSVAKCHNVTGCLLAYRGEDINLAANAPLVCPECGKPVTVTNPLNSSIKKAAHGPRGSRRPGCGDLGVKTNARGLHASIGDEAGSRGRLTHERAVENDSRGRIRPRRFQAASPTPEPVIPPSPPVVVAEDHFEGNMDKAGTRQIQDEVLKRIDLMPNVSQANRDKLYVSVHRARSMGLVLTIQFGSGKTSLTPAELGQLKAALEKPQITALREDPTAVFVILGYADPQGDEKKNYKISLERAEGVTEAMKDKCGVINVMHSVAMGGQKLLDSKVLEKNRVVEVWAVLP